MEQVTELFQRLTFNQSAQEELCCVRKFLMILGFHSPCGQRTQHFTVPEKHNMKNTYSGTIYMYMYMYMYNCVCTCSHNAADIA